MKKIFYILALLLIAVVAVASLSSCQGAKTVTINVYNWGEYISDGSEDTLNVNEEFESYWDEHYFKEYGYHVKVNYTTYASNEDLYAKLKSGATSYDVIIPSDYMIGRMIDDKMLAPINFDLVPNYQYIDENYRNLYYDPQNIYSVPYTCGMVGIIYNTTMVDEEDTGDWSLMFDKALMEKYSGKILQFNNLRDAFGTAMFHAGVSVNTTDMNEWQTSLELLKAQKPYVQSYVMDEIFNKMKGESAAIAPYYAGDFLSMYEDNDNLAFYYPESGTNIFVDAMCIPNTSKNQDAAAIYINFMLEEEIAKANAEYIYYASPHKLVRENEEYIEYMCSIHEDAMEILYPEYEMKTEFYHVLDDDTQRAANGLWEQLKIENTMGYGIYIVTVVIVLIVAAFFAFIGIRKKKRSKYY